MHHARVDFVTPGTGSQSVGTGAVWYEFAVFFETKLRTLQDFLLVRAPFPCWSSIQPGQPQNLAYGGRSALFRVLKLRLAGYLLYPISDMHPTSVENENGIDKFDDLNG